MTLIKSILLGSAAGIVAVASAEAADLPTRKAAPVEYVRVCTVGGITGWTLPGTDTCVKFSGYMTAQFIGGNLNTQYNWAGAGITGGLYNAVTSSVPGVAIPTGALRSMPSLLVQASNAQGNTAFYRNETGWAARANFGFDMASNTAYGPLIAHFDLNVDSTNGLDPLVGGADNTLAYLNTGYLTWAGITAGKAQSFFSFIGGGDNFANFFSPDQRGFNEPLLMAYTASFGGGFTATVSAQSPGPVGPSGGGTDLNGNEFFFTNPSTIGVPGNTEFGGMKWPDIVGALHVKQGWGEAQLSGVIHNVNVSDTTYDGMVGCGAGGAFGCNAQMNKVGWALDAGVKLNLQYWGGGLFGAGDDLVLTGAYARNATWYSGLPDGMWTDGGQVNGNGQPMYLADSFFNPLTNSWATPTAWSVSTLIEHHFTPQFYLDLEGSIGGLTWSGQGGCSFSIVEAGVCPGGASGLGGPLSPHAFTYIVGADLGWNPVTNLNFDLELMYQQVYQQTPNGVVGTVYGYGNVGAPSLGHGMSGYFVPGAWNGDSSGFQGRIRITRYF